MIHRPGRAAFRPRDGQPEPPSSSGHDRRSYTTGGDTIDLTVQRSQPTYCTPSPVTWSNSSSIGLSPTTFPLFSLRGVSSSTSRNWAIRAKAGKARQWLGFQAPFYWLVVETVRCCRHRDAPLVCSGSWL